MKTIVRNTPNFITLLNLSAGAGSVVFSASGDFYLAGILILIASVFDFLDGFAAKVLKAYSSIGKELDSLADIISFGFAPAFLLHVYLKKIMFSEYLTVDLSFVEPLHLTILLTPFLLPVFAAIRLARFNISSNQSKAFKGMPVPAVAIFFTSLVLGVEIQLGNELYVHEVNWLVMVLVFSVLMVVSFPMFSLKFKHYRWRGNEIQYLFIGISLILLVTLQLIGLSLTIILYIFLSGIMNVLHLNRS